ncbi:hypothetical protein OPQ81_011158 [Rhizoctonia solani]|nr:hypothetical protein OPQ81_011158 [Rhizoctonia solani]
MYALAQKIGEHREGNSWYLMVTTDPGQHAYMTRTLRNWHIILGHADPRNILRLRDANLSKGLIIKSTKSISLDPNFDCISCIQGKSHVRPFGEVHTPNSQQIADLIYSNVWGPARVTSIQGSLYYISFIDAATRFTWIIFMRHKNEAVDRYIDLANLIRTQKGHEIKHIHFDNGRELVNNCLCEYCAKTGTEIMTMAPYSSQQNGPTKHKNQSIADSG